MPPRPRIHEEDYLAYLHWRDEALRIGTCALHAYVLMTKHAHLLFMNRRGVFQRQASPSPAVEQGGDEQSLRFCSPYSDKHSLPGALYVAV